jgi:hypothetical protein
LNPNWRRISVACENAREDIMAARPRDYFLWILLAASAIGPAFAQIAMPPAGPGVGPVPAAVPVPNLAGKWAHPYLTGFEPPRSGPGPVRNRSRMPNGKGNFQELVGDYTNPILKPEAAAAVKRHGEISLTGGGYPTPSNQCWPQGVPYIFWDFWMEMIQRPDKVIMIYRHGNEVRWVRMNDRHPAQVTPSWHGDAVGHYEGDTLVIDTVGMKVGPFSMVDMYGTPQSSGLHVVERYRLVDYADARDAIERNEQENFRASGGGEFDVNYRGKVLQLHFTVEDENVFTMPWTATITYRPAISPPTDLICAENPREPDGKLAKVPQADRPDF